MARVKVLGQSFDASGEAGMGDVCSFLFGVLRDVLTAT
jgi:hypothetical protein